MDDDAEAPRADDASIDEPTPGPTGHEGPTRERMVRAEDGTDRELMRLESRSNRRRRSVKQLLFVIAGSHTGAFLGAALPTSFGLPGNLGGALFVVLLFALPFVVDANWERIEGFWLGVTGRE